VYLKIVETESELPKLCRDLIQDYNMVMRLLDSSVGEFAITPLGALFVVLGVQLLLLLHVHLALLASCIGEYISRCFVPALLVR
jgi:hypothetical protein